MQEFGIPHIFGIILYKLYILDTNFIWIHF